MSKRLQVLLHDEEYDEIEEIARRKHLSVSEWARLALRAARKREPGVTADKKLAAVRAALREEFPTGDIDAMLAEIERGYTSGV